jgi:DNA-binding response OmpR family regulator
MYVAENTRVSGYREDFVPSKTRALIWVVERESSIGKLAIENLEQEGFRVSALPMKHEVIQRIKQVSPSLVVIETGAAGDSALDLCRKIRRLDSLARTPVIFLSANASEEERVLGLEAGADDYITESSTGREVVARVRAVMRRFMQHEPYPASAKTPRAFNHYFSAGVLSPTITMGDIEIDPTAMTISIRGNAILTTYLEFRLLYYLLHNEGRVFSRDQLLDAVWGAGFVELRSVDACIRRLRRKIEPEPLRPTYLQTVRGAGYCLRVSGAYAETVVNSQAG